MSQNTTIQTREAKTTENYHVFESADGDTIVGMYVSNGTVDHLGGSEFVTVKVGEGTVEAGLDKTTTNYGVYSTEGDALNGMYVSHDVLAELVEPEGDEYDQEDAPESINLSVAPSTEEAFEEAAADAEDEEEDEGPDEEEEAALVAGDSDDSEDSEDSDEEDEEVEIADEEIGLVEE